MADIYLDNPWHGEIISRYFNLNSGFREGVDRCISVTREGKLAAGVLYDNFRQRSVQMHIVSFMKNWMTRDALWVAFDYPFNQMGVEVIFGPVPSTDTKTLDFDRHIGFKDRGAVLKDAVPGGDLIFLSMYREDCRWLTIKPRTIRRGFDG